ncbi:TetR/AcrR family transcriptional regulator [Asanoa siamensis]|uniref:TetR family transcriptional regulator n=1 Tax=Asanoa siamensis TaxID=926357 RepID=A0ABQ4CJZ1_9ACTN|nr:TetR/AcrR family transcriptional regulator [Asanoa siamensis]GIF71610.1 TetR family transcriptional regulator [Asanoa siamensis]
MTGVDLTAVGVHRPHRADAARNFDALLAAANEVFTEFGADAPLDEVARRAGVGIATLYRNFPTRGQMIQAVYLTEVDAVCRAARDAAALGPWEGITTWLRRFIEYVATKRAVATGLERGSPAHQAATEALYAAGGPLLARAQDAGVFRRDVDIDDVMRFAMAYTTVNFASAAQRDRMLAVAFDGLSGPRPVDGLGGPRPVDGLSGPGR